MELKLRKYKQVESFELVNIEFPFYAKMAFILLSVLIILFILYIGQHILIPIFLSLLFSVLLNPFTVFFNRSLKIPYALSAIISVVLFVFFIASIVFFVSWKMVDIVNDWENIKTNISIHFHNIQLWIKQNLHISYRKQEKYIQQASSGPLIENSELHFIDKCCHAPMMERPERFNEILSGWLEKTPIREMEMA